MQPATMRRLLVFAICLGAVGCLYLVPHAAVPAGSASSRSGSAPTVASPSRVLSAAATVATVAAVSRLRLVGSGPERFTVAWSEPDDDAAALGYSVWLNGFRVRTTVEPRATLTWFNDSDTHVVQVRALDAAGHEGPSSPPLLVTRPTATSSAEDRPPEEDGS